MIRWSDLLRRKRVISFTDKTRFLFMIQKGKGGTEFRNQPYIVNEPIGSAERPIPFPNMIYIGDGASDIPAMSLLTASQGFVIGVLNTSKPYRTWALGYRRRANITVPPDYDSEGHAYAQLRQAATEIADRIRHHLTVPGPLPGF